MAARAGERHPLLQVNDGTFNLSWKRGGSKKKGKKYELVTRLGKRK